MASWHPGRDPGNGPKRRWTGQEGLGRIWSPMILILIFFLLLPIHFPSDPSDLSLWDGKWEKQVMLEASVILMLRWAFWCLTPAPLSSDKANPWKEICLSLKQDVIRMYVPSQWPGFARELHQSSLDGEYPAMKSASWSLQLAVWPTGYGGHTGLAVSWVCVYVWIILRINISPGKPLLRKLCGISL